MSLQWQGFSKAGLAQSATVQMVGSLTDLQMMSAPCNVPFAMLPCYNLSPVMRKPVFGVSDQAPHKPGCATTQDGYRLEISYIESRGIVLSM